MDSLTVDCFGNLQDLATVPRYFVWLWPSKVVLNKRDAWGPRILQCQNDFSNTWIKRGDNDIHSGVCRRICETYLIYNYVTRYSPWSSAKLTLVSWFTPELTTSKVNPSTTSTSLSVIVHTRRRRPPGFMRSNKVSFALQLVSESMRQSAYIHALNVASHALPDAGKNPKTESPLIRTETAFQDEFYPNITPPLCTDCDMDTSHDQQPPISTGVQDSK